MHDIEKSQELAKQEEKFVIKKALEELAKKLEVNSQATQVLEFNFNKVYKRLSDLEEQISENYKTFEKATIALNINLSELEKRLFSLEEKERQRDRDEWQRELALDSGPPDYIPQGDE